MDARSLFAILAIALLFWLLFSWLRWDSNVRLARLSRQRLRERLFELDPSQRAGKPEHAEKTGTAAIVAHASSRRVNQRYSGAESGAFEGSAYKGSTDESGTYQTTDTAFQSTDDTSGSTNAATQSAGIASRPNDTASHSAATENQSTDIANVNQSADAARLAEQVEQARQRAAASKQNDLELRRLSSELQSREAQGANDSAGVEALQQRFHEEQSNLDAAGTGVVDRNGESAAYVSALNSSAMAKNQSAKAQDEVPVPIYQAPSQKDDLKKINGIGPVMERTLNALGVTTFKQVAEFTQGDIDKVSQAIGAFPGRIERDDWVGKARQILQNSEKVV